MADSDDPDVVEIAALARVVTNSGRDDLDFHFKVTREMGAIAATTQREVERLRSAVPARQQTIRHGITAAIVAGAGAAIFLKPEIGWPIAALVAVLGGASIVEQFKKKAEKP